MQKFETVRVECSPSGVWQVLLDRPEASNAINTQMGRDLLSVFSEFAADPHKARCIVLSGAGERAFCAGGDLKERDGMTDDQWQAQHLIYERMVRAVIDCPTPIIAAVNGAAFGGGLELALGCDFMFAAEHARFALTEVTLGIMPGCGGTQNLPRAVGERRAKELILTGRAFSATEALQWGLVNRLCASADLMRDTLEVAERIARNGPVAVRQAKHSIHHGLNASLVDGMMFEIQAYNRLVSTEDRLEGIRAFNEKRQPVFKGR